MKKNNIYKLLATGFALALVTASPKAAIMSHAVYNGLYDDNGYMLGGNRDAHDDTDYGDRPESYWDNYAVSQAAALGKTVGEYSANAVIKTPGLSNAAPIAQGGGCVINGAESNATFTLNAVESGAAEFAVSQADAVGGTALNVVDISAPGVDLTDAEVGFYVAGVKAGDNIAVYRSVKGEWVAVEVAEVSDNTVKIKMDEAGIYCFIKL